VPLSLDWDRIVDGETAERLWERQERELSKPQGALWLIAQGFHYSWD
jgi:hypothetical protein